MIEYSFTHIITQDQIDHNDHVNNLEYIKLGLRAAGEHWNSSANEEMKKLCLWVVKRHEVEYHASARLGDIVTVTTYISEINKATATRKITIKIQDKLICSMTTDWYLLNRQSSRPMRITEDIARVFQ